MQMRIVIVRMVWFLCYKLKVDKVIVMNQSENEIYNVCFCVIMFGYSK